MFYVELEAIALSRDIPVAVRWLVAPIVRNISKNAMLISLRRTEEAVRSTVRAGKTGRPAVASNRDEAVIASSTK